jgi:lysophospholipase L1-like esterase
MSPNTLLRVRPTILLFGDSITEFAFGANGEVGWASLLSSAYSRRADVLSRGFSGYNTKHALGVLQSTLFGKQQDCCNDESKKRKIGGTPNEEGNDVQQVETTVPMLFCTVFFGANDASLPTARQHLPLDEYDTNIRRIINAIREKTHAAHSAGTGGGRSDGDTKTPIILFTPTPVSSKAWDYYCTVSSPRPLSPRSNERSQEYGLKIKEIGKDMGCAVVDAFSLLGGNECEEQYKQYLTDGLHLNGEGNKIIFNGLMDVLRENHKHILPMEYDNSKSDGSFGIPFEEKMWSELC